MTSEPNYRDAQYSRMLLALGSFIIFGVGVAVGAVFGGTSRLGVWIVGAVLLGILMRTSRLVVVVDSQGVRLGPAHVEWQYIGSIEVLDAAAMRTAITTGAHPHDLIRVRDTRAGLRLWLDDPGDPHRCWTASVLRPDALKRALGALGRLPA